MNSTSVTYISRRAVVNYTTEPQSTLSLKRAHCVIMTGAPNDGFLLRDRPLEKVWGGGSGIFEPQEFFFIIKFLV